MNNIAQNIEQLEQATNIFDSAAILYDLCEDRLDSDGWKFAEIERQLLLNDDIRINLHDHQERLAAELRSVTESKTTSVESIIYINQPLCQFVKAAFVQMLDGEQSLGWETAAAAWHCLEAIDQTISARVPALLRRYRGSDYKPYNFNHKDGLHKVFIKTASTFANLLPESKRLPDPSLTERTAAMCLNSLAFTQRSDSVLTIRSVEELWDDFRTEDIPAISLILPAADHESMFPIRKCVIPDQKNGVFWIEACENEGYRKGILKALRQSEKQKANIAILPELCSSEDTIQAICGDAKASPYTCLKLIVAGSFHVNNSLGDKDNLCIILDGRGNVLWEHTKRGAYTLSDANNSEDSGITEYREWISRTSPQELIMSPIGGIATMICLDFLNSTMLRDMCNLGCRWFLVPAWSAKLRGKFEQRLQLIGEYGQAIAAVANNPRAGSKDDYLFYCPIRSSTASSPKGTKYGNEVVICNWIEHIAK